jgi:16S rRNA (guanine(966)-N(2))-methyltransferase RsmD
MDRMRESLFAVLGPSLSGAAFLDLFSGSGIVGLEAASRGASPVVMVEKDAAKKFVLRENAALAHGARTRIMPVERYIKFAQDGPFDIVFLDPPFAYRFKAQLLEMLASSPLLAGSALVLMHHPAQDTLPEKAGALVRSEVRVYGRSHVSFYRKTAPV